MELRHLRYFTAVAEALSVSAAAARLRIAQQGLSRQIADLERELGVRLFERLPRGVRLTRAGQTFLGEARSTLASAERAVARARRAASEEDQVIRAAYADPGPGGDWLARAFADILRREPRVSLHLRQLTSAAQWEALGAGTIDVAIIYTATVELPDFQVQLVRDLSWTGVMLPRGHPLNRRRSLWLAELGDLPLLLFPPEVNPQLYDATVAALRRRGLIPQIDHGASGVATVDWERVALGLGWALLQGSQAGWVPSGTVYRPLRDPPIPLHLAAVRRAEPASPLLDRFVAGLLERAGASPTARGHDVATSNAAALRKPSAPQSTAPSSPPPAERSAR